MVYVPRRTLLEAVALTAKLEICGRGHRTRPRNTVETWVIIDHDVQKATFIGSTTAALDTAEESAAQAALWLPLQQLQYVHQRPQFSGSRRYQGRSPISPRIEPRQANTNSTWRASK